MLPAPRWLLTLWALLPAGPAVALGQDSHWPVHSLERPRPPIVDPGPPPNPVPPPSDAIILFDGHGLDEWQHEDGSRAKWTTNGGYFEVTPGSGTLFTKRRFGDVQVHIEWTTPTPAKGEGQERGNSGVFLMAKYEIQVLDSYRNDTYPDGQAAAVYGQYPPLANASRPPGQWQSYDIVFRRPSFRPDGSVERPAIVTVFHNAVLVQDHIALMGQTVHGQRATYQAHGDRLPLALQDHGNPVRYRNVWIRELTPPRQD